MAKTNKYTSINFNDIFEKKTTATNKSSSSSSSSNSSSSATSLHKHGGMLVLTRPSPKPIQPKPQTPKPILQSNADQQPLQSRSESTISLRPLGHTGSSSFTPKDREPPQTTPVVSLKPEPFVPPHLRPGFVGKEEKFGQNGQQRTQSHGQVQDTGRPKSGGGGYVNRPSSSGNNNNNNNRPSSAGGGWYGSSYKSPNHHF